MFASPDNVQMEYLSKEYPTTRFAAQLLDDSWLSHRVYKLFTVHHFLLAASWLCCTTRQARTSMQPSQV